MTVTLELEPPLEAAARAEAAARGIGVEEYLHTLLKDTLPPIAGQEERAARVRATAGKYAHLGPSRLLEER